MKLSSVIRHFFRPRTTDALAPVVRDFAGGIFKRIDENRELLELIIAQAPQLLEQNPWVIGWIAQTDEYLCLLASVAAARGILAEEGRPPQCRDHFPRPWPSAPRRATGIPRRWERAANEMRPVFEDVVQPVPAEAA